MPIDILDQPRGGILEATTLYLYKNGGSFFLDALIKNMTGSDEGKNYFKRNVIGILKAVGLVEIGEDERILLRNCDIIKRRPEERPFDIYFKVELLSKIAQSNKPNVKYLSDVLRKMFASQELFDTTALEGFLRESRSNRGISVSRGEELGGKIDFCLTLFKYFNMIQRIGGSYCAYVPRDLLQVMFSMAIEDLDKPSVKLYSELLDYLDKNYLPILDRKENKILEVVHRTLGNREFISFFKFAHVPDGGRAVLLSNREFNAIITR